MVGLKDKEETVSIRGNCIFSDHNILLWIMFTSSGCRGKVVSGERDKFNRNDMNIKDCWIREIQLRTIKLELLYSLKIMKIVKNKTQKNTSIENEVCWILFCSSVSISFITWSNIAQSLKSWTILNSQRKGLFKNVEDENSYCIIGR